MNPDNLKEAWRAQTSQTRLIIHADLLLNEVRRNERSFKAMIFWRDVREIGIALVMVPVWFYLGATHALPWTWYAMVPAMLWIAGFMLVDRRRHKQHPPEAGEPLGQRVASSLAQVEHQIWLLRNVFWWYLLPPGLAMMAFFGQIAWTIRGGGWWVLLVVVGMTAVAGAILAGVYWLNQHAVRSQLEPRRQELQALLASLKDTGEPAPAPKGPDAGPAPSKTATLMSLLVIVGFLAASATLSSGADRASTTTLNGSYCPAAGDRAVTNLLVPIRKKYQVPAIAAALVTSKGLVVAGVVGTRKRGTEIAATLNDLWHLG